MSFKQEFPLHCFAWNNDYKELDRFIVCKRCQIEKRDPRGRTPLHLAVTLGHIECVRVLLCHGADVFAENNGCWTVLHEAICTGDPELVRLVLQYRDFEDHSKRRFGINELLQKLEQTPDFYVEMKWELASWIPMTSFNCPSDTYKVWKKAHDSAITMQIDHDNRCYSKAIHTTCTVSDLRMERPSDNDVASRLSSPVINTYFDTDSVSFERSKSGILTWRSNKMETISNYNCKSTERSMVFMASNVNIVTKTRMEHLSNQDKKSAREGHVSFMERFLTTTTTEKQDITRVTDQCADVDNKSDNATSTTLEKYFNPLLDLGSRDIGCPMDLTTKIQKFKASIWLCEDCPLSLQEQIMPIIDLMARSNANFARLQDFITLQLPSGFPIKIEIPLYHILNVRVTFSNLFASDFPRDYVTSVSGTILSCVIDDQCFDAPESYCEVGNQQYKQTRDEEDELLQYAIQQSLLQDEGSGQEQITLLEALNGACPVADDNCEQSNERTMSVDSAVDFVGDGASLGQNLCSDLQMMEMVPDGDDNEMQLLLAIRMSKHEARMVAMQQKQEDEEVERILQLSLMDQ